MKTHYKISQKEQNKMSCIPNFGQGLLESIIEALPKRITRHSERVRNIACMMAQYVPDELVPEGMDRSGYIFTLSKGAYFHDMGILLYGNDVEKHPLAIEKIMKENDCFDLSFPDNAVILETVRGHKERYDGKGYPDGLSGEDIPIHASVCGIADTVDMIMGESMFPAKKIKEAASFIQQNSRILFRPDAVTCFERAQKEIYDLYLLFCDKKD